jgi:hypothetical protein
MLKMTRWAVAARILILIRDRLFWFWSSDLCGCSEIDQCDGEIEAEMDRAREAVAEKGRALEDDRERVQKAALAALDILSGGGVWPYSKWLRP